VHPATTGGGHLRFTEGEVALLERRLGFAPTVSGLTREEVLTATTLLRHPLWTGIVAYQSGSVTYSGTPMFAIST
jgi:hypothetical protein